MDAVLGTVMIVTVNIDGQGATKQCKCQLVMFAMMQVVQVAFR